MLSSSSSYWSSNIEKNTSIVHFIPKFWCSFGWLECPQCPSNLSFLPKFWSFWHEVPTAVCRFEAGSVARPRRSSITAFFADSRRGRRRRRCRPQFRTDHRLSRTSVVTIHDVTYDWVDGGNTWHAMCARRRRIFESQKSRFFRLASLFTSRD